MDPITLAIIGGVGLITQGLGTFFGAQAQAEQAEREARIKDEQASEVIKRSKINIEDVNVKTRFQVGTQASQYAASGVDLGSVSVLAVQQATLFQAQREIENINEQAEFDARMIRLGAESDRQAASQTRQAGTIGAIGGTILGGANLVGRMS